jgi:Mn-dependent DtxR family transcriptional regulator
MIFHANQLTPKELSMLRRVRLGLGSNDPSAIAAVERLQQFGYVAKAGSTCELTSKGEKRYTELLLEVVADWRATELG